MDLPSGDHFALSASVAIEVSFLGLVVAPVVPSKSASHTCCEPSRLDVNRMRLLSGANSRPLSPGWATAIFIGSPPAICCSHSSVFFWFWSRSTVVTAYASHLPSGDTEVSPRRFICIMSSNVMGRLVPACAIASPDVANEKTRRKTEGSLFIEVPIRAIPGLKSETWGTHVQSLREGKVYTRWRCQGSGVGCQMWDHHQRGRMLRTSRNADPSLRCASFRMTNPGGGEP